MELCHKFNIKKINIEKINENYLQSSLWANIKTDQEKSPWRAIGFEAEILKKILILERKLFKNHYLAYVAHPEFSNKNLKNINLEKIDKLIKYFSLNIKNFLNKNTIFIRYDLMYFKSRKINDPYNLFYKEKIQFRSLKKAFYDIQPKDTTIINLKSSIDEILSKMKKKTRYNIKLSKRKDIEVYNDTEFKNFDEFYKLYKKTALRNKFSIHSKIYIQNLIKKFKSDENADIHLIKVIYKNKLISAIIIGIYKDKATYLYGASCNNNRNLMSNYAAQFKAIEILKELNIKEYDLLGIPPFLNKKHPLSGLFQFKTGFGGDIIHRVGSYDFVCKNFLYKIYIILEKFRYFYYKVIKKRL